MKFYPEGHLIDKAENKASMQTPAALSDAMRDGKILEARSIICDNEHNLIVDLKCMRGIIPREEGALGIREGTVRDIAIISRVNKPVCFIITDNLTYPPEQRNIGEVYNLITQCSESQLDSLFDVLPLTHPAKAPYSLYQRASDSVRSGVISGLGSRLQVFQSELIKRITAYDEISLELPGQQPCAYYLVTSDQDSTFDFLASLFLSFAFIKLVRYADATCPGGRLPVPVHILGEELTACGTISELSRRISVIRSRNISMSCVFQNLAGLQNRYPQNQWQEILGNCDVQLFLGCTDQLTAEYVSQRTGIASVMVSSTSKALNTLRVSDYTLQYRESNGIGKRPLLTPDEVLRLPVDEALVILRGHKVLKVHKMDYSLHPAYKHLRECKASAHIPEWQTAVPETPSAITPSTAPIAKTPPKRRGRKPKTVVAADKTSIMTKPENEKELSHGNEQWYFYP